MGKTSVSIDTYADGETIKKRLRVEVLAVRRELFVSGTGEVSGVLSLSPIS